MTNSNVSSNGFSFAGVRDAKKERTEKIESARRDQEYENYKAKELAEAQIRNSKIAKGNEFNFSACIKELRDDINQTKASMREEVRESTRNARQNRDSTIYAVKRDYDLSIIWFDQNGRVDDGGWYFKSVSKITKQDIIKEKENIVKAALRRPTDFKGKFGFAFDGRIDISTRDPKDGYSDYEIGEYFGGNIWDSENGWHHQ